MIMDKTQRVMLVVACLVAAAFGVLGVRAAIGYAACHQQVEQIGLGLTPAYDPVTGICTIKL